MALRDYLCANDNSNIPKILVDVQGKVVQHTNISDRSLDNLRTPGERLAAYREYLGLSYAKMGKLYGIPPANLEYYEKKAKNIPTDFLDVMRDTSPPPGKVPPSISWLATGEGQMLSGSMSGSAHGSTRVTGTLRAQERGDSMVAEGRAGYPEGLPKEVTEAIQKAVQMTEDFISVIPLEKRMEDPVKKGAFIAVVAELLVAGRQEEIPDMMKSVIRAFSRSPTAQ